MARPQRFDRLTALLALTLALAPAAVGAQVGEAIAFREGDAIGGATELLVLRPRSERGTAGLLVYVQDGAGWRLAERLGPVSPANPFEGFSASLSLSASGDAVAVGAADADRLAAASVYRRSGGQWVPDGRVAAGETGSPGDRALDLAGLGRLMQPPPRVVALDPGDSILAAWMPEAERSVVSIFGRGPDGWTLRAELFAGDSAGFGAPVALAFDPATERLVVGAPERGPSGAVLVFEPSHAGWDIAAELRDASLPAGARLGWSLALGHDRILAGAPGADRVLEFGAEAGDWTRLHVVEPPAPPAGADPAASPRLFGLALALSPDGDRLWVGAPYDDHLTGRVWRLAPDARDGWRVLGSTDGGASVGELFGAAVALSRGHVAVGAPGAAGGIGAVAVFPATRDELGPPHWIRGAPALAAVTDGEARCQDGRAAGFACEDVDLLAFLSLDALGGGPDERVSDLWGWADPETGREYALVGRSAGMLVVDVTSPSSPVVVALVPANASGARDIKTYADHAFMTGDGAGAHGLVVFDLRRLRDLPATAAPAGGGPAVPRLDPDTVYTGIGSAHNLILDPEMGIAIPVGASGGGQTCGGGLHMVDVRTPLEPAFLGCYTDRVGMIAPGRTHDGQCVVYSGPDSRYAGRRICLASNETALRIVDITDPAAVQEVALARYPGAAYTHQGWLTEDQGYFFMNDELDEMVGLTERTRTLIWDVAELDDPVLVGEYLGPDGATDHNLFIRGNRMYQANYQGGFHLVDISDPENPVAIGTFDTTPYDGNPPGFATGAWTAYPFLPSGTVIVSSMYEGLFVLRARPVVP